LAVGATFKFNVTVTNTPFNFAGWDITVVTNPAVLSPQSIADCNTSTCNAPYSDSGGTNFMPGGTDAQCINGTPSGAFNPCTGNDGPGVAHDAFASSGFTGGALLLFTITYTVIASGTTNVVLGPDLAHPESTTGTTNHIFDTSGLDIAADETGGFYGSVAPTLISVVRGTDGALYSSSFASAWSAFTPLQGSSPSAPSLCAVNPATVEIVVRGTDNGIYHKTFSSGTWSATWDKNPTGVTIDQPVCAILGTTLYVVVRGATSELFATTFDLSARTWAASWTDLNGATFSVPALVATSSASRLDLVVRGTDNGIYHKAFTAGAWAATWDTPAVPQIDATIATPAIASTGSSLAVVVRGTESQVYYATLTFAGVWSGFTPLGGSTPIAPTLVIDSAGTLHLVLRGFDNVIYEKAKTSTGAFDATWSTAGGGTLNKPAATVRGTNISVIATGFDNQPYSNTFNGTTWSGWVGLGGASTVNPSVSAVP